MTERVLDVVAVSAGYGKMPIINDINIHVDHQNIVTVIGPNGAGKSTIFNIIAGALKPDAGSVVLDGVDITGRPPHALHAMGLLRTFQVAQEFHLMTVFENLLAAAPNPAGDNLLRAFLAPASVRAREAANRERAEQVMRFVSLDHLADSPAGAISGGQKKLLELGRTLMVDAKIILLDEIAAGVNRTLLKDIVSRIRELNSERELTFCIIEHDMGFIAELCDHVIVMAEGRVLNQGSMAALREDERVVEAYFGGGRSRASTH